MLDVQTATDDAEAAADDAEALRTRIPHHPVRMARNRRTNGLTPGSDEIPTLAQHTSKSLISRKKAARPHIGGSWNGETSSQPRPCGESCVDYTKQRDTRKRGGGAKAISLDEAKLVPDDRGSDLLLLDSTEG